MHLQVVREIKRMGADIHGVPILVESFDGTTGTVTVKVETTGHVLATSTKPTWEEALVDAGEQVEHQWRDMKMQQFLLALDQQLSDFRAARAAVFSVPVSIPAPATAPVSAPPAPPVD